MRIVILFGTESGTAEFVAEDLAAAITDLDSTIEVDVVDMANQSANDIDADTFHIVICSTYGDGELPATARPFYADLESGTPDLTGMQYAVFGMGDSSYSDTYSHGSEIIDAKLTELGATRVGEYGRHDASGRETASDVALEWLEGVLRDSLLLAALPAKSR